MFFRIVRFYAKYLALNDRDGMENVLAISVRGYSIVVVLVLLQFPCAFLFMELLVRISKLTQTSHTENIPYALINQLELNVESHSRTLLCTQTTHPKSGQIVQESFQERFDQQDF